MDGGVKVDIHVHTRKTADPPDLLTPPAAPVHARKTGSVIHVIRWRNEYSCWMAVPAPTPAVLEVAAHRNYRVILTTNSHAPKFGP